MERGVGVLDEAQSFPPPRLKRFARPFPFYNHGTPPATRMWRSLIGQILKNYATIARQIFFGWQNHFLMEMRRAFGFQCEVENKLKTILLLLVLQEGLY